MIFTPTESKRNVVLALQVVRTKATRSKFQSTETPRIARIRAFFADHECITEDFYNDNDEATLLRRFWKAIHASDRIFAADVQRCLSLIRRRSWDLDVIPSPEIDLRRVYCPELWDTQRMWRRGEICCSEHRTSISGVF
jgi:hypothetical protein